MLIIGSYNIAAHNKAMLGGGVKGNLSLQLAYPRGTKNIKK